MITEKKTRLIVQILSQRYTFIVGEGRGGYQLNSKLKVINK